MRQNLEAKQSFTYAGKSLKVGDTFSAPRGDARVLRAIGKAVPASGEGATSAPAKKTTAPAVKRAPAKKTSKAKAQ